MTKGGSWSLKQRILIQLASRLGYLLTLPLLSSLKVIKLNYKKENKSVIYALWHGAQFSFYFLNPKNEINILISPSVDGEIISKYSNFFGFQTIRGSLKNKGQKALREILNKIELGEKIGYTVDGPRGPIYKVKPGIVRMAKMSGCPIIPISAVAKNCKVVNSWDKFQIPKLFSKVIMVFGDPIYVDKDISKEEAEDKRLEVEEKLFDLERQAKDYLVKK